MKIRINDFPFNHGCCLHNNKTNKFLIMLSEIISEHDKDGILTGMILRGSDQNDVELLKDEELFLKNLFIYECAHALHPDYKELECDTWAFKQLKEEYKKV